MSAHGPESTLQTYPISLKKFFKIWFSKDPNSFLGFENQLRFIRFRLSNPGATISFVYSRHCLSDAAHAEMLSFCEQFNLIPLDFDSLSAEIDNEPDQALYDIAQEEITRALKNEGGNLAAASDCARLLVPLLEKAGIYSDFDLEIDTQTSPELFMAQAPVLYPAEEMGDMPAINNELLVVSHEPGNPDKIHPEARVQLHHVRDTIIERYRAAGEAVTFLPIGLKHMEGQMIGELLKRLQDKIDLSNIYAIRQATKNVSNEILRDLFDAKSQEEFDYLHHRLYQVTVEYMSGPLLLQCLHKDIIPSEGFRVNHALIQPRVEPEEAWSEFVKRSLEGSIWQYSDVFKIKSSNTLEAMKAMSSKLHACASPLDLVGECGDQSWTPIGETKMQQRVAKMEEAATCIQRTYRAYRMKA